MKEIVIRSQLDLGDGDSLAEFTTYLERIHSKLNEMGLGACHRYVIYISSVFRPNRRYAPQPAICTIE